MIGHKKEYDKSEEVQRRFHTWQLLRGRSRLVILVFLLLFTWVLVFFSKQKSVMPVAPFAVQVVTLPLHAYPPSAMPYHIASHDFWLVHMSDQIMAFSSLAPYADHPDDGNRPESCRYMWVAASGRFVDPCSGDEWELDGTLNLEASPELWSEGDLDQYPVTVEDDTIIIDLNKIIQGAPAATVQPHKSLNEPQVDLPAVAQQVTYLADLQQAALASQSGWLHTYVEVFVPLEQRGEGGLNQALFPTEQMFIDSWYRTTIDGRFDLSVSRHLDTNGNMTQASVFAGGRFVNLTLDQISRAPSDTLPIPNMTVYAAQQLQEMSTFTTNPPAATAYLTQVNGRSHYVVHSTITYASPVEADDLGETVTAEETIYTFDFETGQLLVHETASHTSDNERLVHYRASYLVEEMTDELPEEIATILAQGETILNDPSYVASNSYTWDAPTPTIAPNLDPVLAVTSSHAITVSVTDISTDSQSTTVATSIQVSPGWAMNANAFPPQQALSSNVVLQASNGETFMPVSSVGQRATVDPVTGGLRQEMEHTFTGIAAANSGLVLQTDVDLSMLHRVISLPLTLEGAQVGQTWPLNWSLPVESALLHISEVTWEEETAAGNARLRFTVTDGRAAGIDIYCVHLAADDPWQGTCANFDGEKTFTAVMPPDEPIVLHLRLHLRIGPFELNW